MPRDLKCLRPSLIFDRDGKLSSVFCDGLRVPKSTSKGHPPSKRHIACPLSILAKPSVGVDPLGILCRIRVHIPRSKIGKLAWQAQSVGIFAQRNTVESTAYRYLPLFSDRGNYYNLKETSVHEWALVSFIS